MKFQKMQLWLTYQCGQGMQRPVFTFCPVALLFMMSSQLVTLFPQHTDLSLLQSESAPKWTCSIDRRPPKRTQRIYAHGGKDQFFFSLSELH